jgi:2-polyprenyl-3-methyl-5-hydroxy-6-metoxy-1,4-benzoquinol methylase
MSGQFMAGSLVHRRCPVCEGNHASPLLRKESLQLVRCSFCGMTYADPVAADLASGKYYDGLGDSFYLSPDKLESDYAAVRFERELRIFRSYCPAGAVLDVGCSTGAFLYQLKTRFPQDYTVVGTDVTRAALQHARQQGLEILEGQFLAHDFGARQFEAVTFWAVLEHLVEPRQFLAKATQLLKPRGHAFILVPNLHSLAVRLLGAKYRYLMPDHVNYFTAASLTRLLRQFPELELRAIRTTHFNPLVIWQDYRGAGRPVPDADRARLLKKTTRYKQNPWLKPLKGLYRAAEALLAAIGWADNLVAVVHK